jgi:hypothetical protein
MKLVYTILFSLALGSSSLLGEAASAESNQVSQVDLKVLLSLNQLEEYYRRETREIATAQAGGPEAKKLKIDYLPLIHHIEKDLAKKTDINSIVTILRNEYSEGESTGLSIGHPKMRWLATLVEGLESYLQRTTPKD